MCGGPSCALQTWGRGHLDQASVLHGKLPGPTARHVQRCRAGRPARVDDAAALRALCRSASFNARHNDDGACLRTEAYSRLSLRTEGLISTFTTEDGREITNIEDLEEYVACAYASKRE